MVSSLFIEKKIMPYIKIALSHVWKEKASFVTIQTCSSILIIEIIENKTPLHFPLSLRLKFAITCPDLTQVLFKQ